MNFQEIYCIVKQIPPGKVLTYGRIAIMLGRPLAARAVGMALRNSPQDLSIPAHRVVNKKGTMAPGDIFGGEEMQRSILRREGVVFLENGTINMSESLWGPEQEVF